MTPIGDTARPRLQAVDLDMAIAVGVAGRVSVAADGARSLGRLLGVGDIGAAREVRR